MPSDPAPQISMKKEVKVEQDEVFFQFAYFNFVRKKYVRISPILEVVQWLKLVVCYLMLRFIYPLPPFSSERYLFLVHC